MCTVITDGSIFGRTLDLETSLGEKVVALPRGHVFRFRHESDVASEYAIIGMARVEGDTPLFFDGMNECGVAVAALNFKGFAHYGSTVSSKRHLASYEVIPRLLSTCRTAEECREMLGEADITDDAFCPSMPPTDLHWIISDRTSSFTVEPTKRGVYVYENKLGVLTNAPDFPFHVYNAACYMSLSASPPKDRMTGRGILPLFSRGMGAFGLPGDFSSPSRFVRGVYAKYNTQRMEDDTDGINRHFHIMDAVSQPLGCVLTDEGKPVYTVYAACMNLDTGEYHYVTYENRRVRTEKIKLPDDVHRHSSDL